MIKDLLSSGSNVTIAVSVQDLEEWTKHLISEAKRELTQEAKANDSKSYLTAKEVCEKLSIDPSTLWRWDKKDYLKPIIVGGHRRYDKADVTEILKAKRGSNL